MDTAKRPTHEITGVRYFCCFVIANLPIIFFLYHLISVGVAFFNNEANTANLPRPVTSKSIVDPQTVLIITAIMICIESVIRTERGLMRAFIYQINRITHI